MGGGGIITDLLHKCLQKHKSYMQKPPNEHTEHRETNVKTFLTFVWNIKAQRQQTDKE